MTWEEFKEKYDWLFTTSIFNNKEEDEFWNPSLGLMTLVWYDESAQTSCEVFLPIADKHFSNGAPVLLTTRCFTVCQYSWHNDPCTTMYIHLPSLTEEKQKVFDTAVEIFKLFTELQ